MDYNCELCNFTTKKKIEYTRHIQTIKHQSNIKSVQLNCDICNEKFNSKSSYYRHIKKCNNTNLELQNKINDLENKLLKEKYEKDIKDIIIKHEKEKIKILKSVVKNSNSTTKTALKISSKSISAIKYANENFKNAPQLESLTDFNMMGYNLDNDIEKKKLVDNLLYHYRQNSVHKIFGDHIVGLYKKDNLANQSMHATDTSRMNYIVRGSKDGNSLKWHIDKNGIMICDIIIDKLINHFVDILKWYQKNLIDDMNLEPSRVYLDKQNKVENILGMLMNVDNGQLVKDTNKYIAPFFNLDK